MNFDEIKKNYIKNCADVEKVKDKIILREQQIARLEKKRNKLIENNYVSKSIIIPLLELVNDYYPNIQWGEVHPPMGLRSAVSVFGKDITNDLTIGLTFTHTETFIAVDVKTNYKSVHGFGSQTVEINCITNLLDVINNKIKNNK